MGDDRRPAGVDTCVALTGLGHQLFMRKRRARALLLSGVGASAGLVMMWLALA